MPFATLPLKAGPCFCALDAEGFARPGAARVSGVFLFDTRHLSAWAWTLPGFDLLHEEAGGDRLVQHWSRFRAHEQDVLVRRELALRPDGLDDVLDLVCEAGTPQEVAPVLTFDADFVDVFELRGRERRIPRSPVERTGAGDDWRASYVAQDGIVSDTRVTLEGFAPGETLRLAPGETRRIAARARFSSTLDRPVARAAPNWTPAAEDLRARAGPVLGQAFADVETLLMPSPAGDVIAAGVPNFVNVFGRDSLITAMLLLEAMPDLAAATLRVLAAHRGRAHDPERQEAPGRIAHELRLGELARTGDVPFGRYYGTHDANALFLWLLDAHADAAGSDALVRELEPAWRAALAWIEGARDADGLLRYDAARVGRGLTHTSWKDSDDSVSYSDGRLARGRLAVVEIQGYLVPAFEAAARLGERLGGPAEEAARLRAEAGRMRSALDRFWVEALGCHAIALDEDGAPCDTATSNPGHLLWAGALSEARAAEVAERLMRPDLWSGWGLRTLSTEAARYKPLSYHNGSVWPHDTGLFGLGLLRYGHAERAGEVMRALEAYGEAHAPGRHLPELFAGYARGGPVPPLPYVETCVPQAWAAAALLGLRLRSEGASSSRSERRTDAERRSA